MTDYDMTHYDFREQLAMSIERRGKPFEDIIASSIPGVVSVCKTDIAVDKTGIDYIATLRRGATIGIDLKVRAEGCSKFWKHGDELALEKWSVCPDLRCPDGKAGWTLDESKKTDYTLHSFDPCDSDTVYLLPFHLLRKSFVCNLKEWYRDYKHAWQSSGDWQSECVFVPVSIVLEAIKQSSVIRVD